MDVQCVEGRSLDCSSAVVLLLQTPELDTRRASCASRNPQDRISLHAEVISDAVLRAVSAAKSEERHNMSKKFPMPCPSFTHRRSRQQHPRRHQQTPCASSPWLTWRPACRSRGPPSTACVPVPPTPPASPSPLPSDSSFRV